MTRIVLVHGWGFDATLWSGVRERLGEACDTLDLGYFGAASDVRGGLASGQPVLAVGHSLGLLWLLQQAPLPEGARFLGINAFARFAKADDFPDGVPPRVLDRMITGLSRDAGDVLHAFRARCGVGPGADTAFTRAIPGGAADVQALRDGLVLLRDADARAGAGRVTAVLAAEDDPLVSVAMTEGSFPRDRIRWAGQGGHMLPLTRPDLCADFIRQATREADHAT